jgi:hypothetical protein
MPETVQGKPEWMLAEGAPLKNLCLSKRPPGSARTVTGTGFNSAACPAQYV